MNFEQHVIEELRTLNAKVDKVSEQVAIHRGLIAAVAAIGTLLAGGVVSLVVHVLGG